MTSKKNRKRYEEELALFLEAQQNVQPSDHDDAAYGTFRRHIEEQVEGETRAFHELRSAAETKLHEAPSHLTRSPPLADKTIKSNPRETLTSPSSDRPISSQSKSQAPAGSVPSEPRAQRSEPRQPHPAAAKKAKKEGGLAAAREAKALLESRHAASAARADDATLPRAPGHQTATHANAPLALPFPSSPRGGSWVINVLLSLSFVALGGLSFQVWQQWQQKNDPQAQRPRASGKVKSMREAHHKTAEGLCPPALTIAKNPEPPVLMPLASQTSPAEAPSSVAKAPVAAPAPQTLAGASEKISENAPLALGTTQKVILTQNGEVRRGPSKQYDILDVLPAGTSVEGYPTSDKQWLRLEGGRFIALQQSELIETAADAAMVDRWVAARTANVRALPSLEAAIIKKIGQGEALRLSPLNSRWGRLENGGYIFLTLLTDTAPVPVLHLPAAMRVTSEQATIYTGPGAHFAPVGIYFRNHQVEASELRDGWFRVGRDQFIKDQDLVPIAVNAKNQHQL